MRINDAGLALIKAREGLHDGDKSTPVLEPVMCPAGVWTVGYGHAMTQGAAQLKGLPSKGAAFDLWRARWPHGMTEADAEALLRDDLSTVEAQVSAAVTVPLTPNQFSALVSFTYNVGIGALRKSTLLRRLNAGDYAAVPGEMTKWTKAGGRVLPGLVTRRALEGELWARPEAAPAAPALEAQAVDAPAPQASPGLTITAITGAVAPAAGAISGVLGVVQSPAVQITLIIVSAVLAAGAFVAWRRGWLGGRS